MIDYEETHVRDEAILFIHGIGASRWMWWQQSHAFSDHQVILVDSPGRGKSVATPWVSVKKPESSREDSGLNIMQHLHLINSDFANATSI